MLTHSQKYNFSSQFLRILHPPYSHMLIQQHNIQASGHALDIFSLSPVVISGYEEGPRCFVSVARYEWYNGFRYDSIISRLRFKQHQDQLRRKLKQMHYLYSNEFCLQLLMRLQDNSFKNYIIYIYYLSNTTSSANIIRLFYWHSACDISVLRSFYSQFRKWLRKAIVLPFFCLNNQYKYWGFVFDKADIILH